MSSSNKITEKIANLFIALFNLIIKDDGSSEFCGSISFNLDELETKWAKLFIYDQFIKLITFCSIIILVVLNKNIYPYYMVVIMAMFGLIIIKTIISYRISYYYKRNYPIKPKPNSAIIIECRRNFGLLYTKDKFYYGQNWFYKKSADPSGSLEISEEIYIRNASKEFDFLMIIFVLLFPLCVYLIFKQDKIMLGMVAVLYMLYWSYTYNRVTNVVSKEVFYSKIGK